MAKVDELQMMYNVVSTSVLSSMSDKHKVQQIAAGAALFTLKICRSYELDARECALEIPYWIHRILNSPDEAFADLKIEKQEEIRAMEPPEFRARMLLNFQDKLASLKFLDPAAGCGNFLVETYISLRTLENEIIKELVRLGVNFNERAQGTA